MNPSTILRTRVLAGIAATALPITGLASGAKVSPLSKRLSLAAPAGAEYVVTGTTVTGTGPRLTLLAKVTDYTSLPGIAEDRTVYARGNKLSYWEDGLHVTIDLASKDDYAGRLAEMTAGRVGHFCHDSLSYSPGKGGLSDPHQVFGSGIPCVESLESVPPQEIPAAFRTLLDGLISAGTEGWGSGASFSFERERILGQSPQNTAEAAEIVTILQQHIVALSAALEETEMEQFMTSRLVSSSLVLADGRSSVRMMESCSRLGHLHPQANTGEKWLAVILGAGARDSDAPDRALGSDDPYAADLSKLALPGALALLDESTPPVAAPGVGLQATKFADWLGGYPGLAVVDLNSDPDGDGLTTLMEYALGSDPGKFSAGGTPELGAEADGDDQYLTISYRKDLTKTDIAYRVESSRDLGEENWSAAEVVDVAVGAENSGGIQLRVARIRREGDRRFLRLSIIKAR